jgi:predicted Fe-S protein YdhL (DUF1289 family)
MGFNKSQYMVFYDKYWRSLVSGALTPCAGRCSTVFGDSVCRGCRRFNHEVINWNKYSLEEQRLIWQRLDSQLDQILLPLIAIDDEQALDAFLKSQQVRLLESASKGRKIYHALRSCLRHPANISRTGLALDAEQVNPAWMLFEQRIYSLAVASFEMAWLRAAQFGLQAQ